MQSLVKCADDLAGGNPTRAQIESGMCKLTAHTLPERKQRQEPNRITSIGLQ